MIGANYWTKNDVVNNKKWHFIRAQTMHLSCVWDLLETANIMYQQKWQVTQMTVFFFTYGKMSSPCLETVVIVFGKIWKVIRSAYPDSLIMEFL